MKASAVYSGEGRVPGNRPKRGGRESTKGGEKSARGCTRENYVEENPPEVYDRVGGCG
ncbi:putative 5'-nucleotidase-like protein [Anopheles sinensis]|uniref:Putative 5'-nucleotidase-like protein n=1 Tax=Anopheles sinensis TaxID=74873 RepID=A0A084W6R4_ANOSI|nr:putative 5'-nucleotidase-like protein [Anopheles sinensis]